MNIAFEMLWHRKSRFALTVAGISVAFFLSSAQIGVLVGWCDTCTALIRHADVDLWVMAPRTSTFENGTAIPRARVNQIRNIEGVGWAEAFFLGWNTWQCPDGRRVSILLIGLDDGGVGGPWAMKEGLASAVQVPETVVVDDLYRRNLGVSRLGEESELIGQRAVVGGFSLHVRSLTASPWVFTSIETAIRYDRRYRGDEVTYVLVRCAAGSDPRRVRDDIAGQLPNVEILTAREFAIRTMRYWLLDTGLGATVVVTAVLGLVVGAFIMSQTLVALTQEHLAHYATLLALGFSPARLTSIILVQSLILACSGLAIGAQGFFLAHWALKDSPIPMETTPAIFASLVLASLAGCVIASFASIHSVFRIDPISVFRV